MKTPELETISIFSKDIALNLTINQISKILNKSYAFTNKYIRDFLDEGILSKKIVGSAILCSLNYSNEKTLGLLMLNAIEEKMNFISKANLKILKEVESLKDTPTLQSLMVARDKFFIICDDKKSVQDHVRSLKYKNVVVMDRNEFKLNIRSFDLSKIIIMEGYETFWKLISEMV